MSKLRSRSQQLRASRWPLFMAAGVLLLLVLALPGVWRWKLSRQPGPPALDVAGLDPEVARLIRSASAEVLAHRRSADAWGKLGAVLFQYEFVEESRRALAEAERLAPADPRWPYWQGLLLMAREPGTALQKFERAVQLCPELPDAPRVRLALLLAESGRNEAAEAQFDRLLNLVPEHPLALLGKARLRLADGRFAEGTNYLRSCLADARTAKSAQALEALLLEALGDEVGARAAARRSAARSPDRPWPDPYWEEGQTYRVGHKAWLEEATTLLDQNHPAEALEVLARISRAYPEDGESWYLAGWARNQLQQAPEAERALREHLRLTPDSVKGLAQLGVSLLAQRRFGEAAAVLEKALQLKSTWRELHSNLAYACVQLGRVAEAERQYADALAVDPNYVPTLTALAELALRRGNSTEARRFLEAAQALDPDNPLVRQLWKRSDPPR